MIDTSPIIVLGMHRSGTSMTASILSQLGIDMGTDDLRYCEDPTIRNYNDQLMQSVLGTWDNPPPIDSIPTASKIVDTELPNYFSQKKDPWGWKDPRSILTFPALTKHIPKYKLVVIRRDHQAVISNLMLESRFEYEPALRIVNRYNAQLNSIVKSSPLTCELLELKYEEVLAAPEEWVKVIARFLGRRSRKDAIELVDPSKNHYKPINEKFTAVCVVYEVVDLFQIAYESFRMHYPDVSLIVVDNSETDDVRNYIHSVEYGYQINYLRNDRNVGHGPGIDMGIQKAKTDYIYLFDSDTEMVRHGILESTRKIFSNDPKTYGIGYVMPHSQDGKDLQYLHPAICVVSRKKYKSLSSAVDSPMPFLPPMLEMDDSGFHLVDFTVSEYVVHKVGGTRTEYVPSWNIGE